MDAIYRDLQTRGYRLIAGTDEVGMGCLAGPVVASVVILDPLNVPAGIKDSKLLSPAKREELSPLIQAAAVAYAFGWAEVDEIDTINIFQAARLAMKRALEKLVPLPDFLLVDGRAKVDTAVPQQSLIRGDRISVSIGAASVLAKVYRDRWMARLDEKYPGWGFAQHKGYGSVLHRTQLARLGQSSIHRKSFSWTPV